MREFHLLVGCFCFVLELIVKEALYLSEINFGGPVSTMKDIILYATYFRM